MLSAELGLMIIYRSLALFVAGMMMVVVWRERDWRSPVLVTPAVTTAWNVTRAEEVSLDNLAPLKSAAVPTELLVLGCGKRAAFIAPDIRAALKGAGLALEVVDTGSACRIYNVLLAEGRRVAAALIPV